MGDTDSSKIRKGKRAGRFGEKCRRLQPLVGRPVIGCKGALPRAWHPTSPREVDNTKYQNLIISVIVLRAFRNTARGN